MINQQLAELQALYDGLQGFDGGQDSFVLPINLNENEYVAAENVIGRGGVIQTRPDSRAIMSCPCNTGAQGCTMFQAANGIPYIVFASYGSIYVSAKPFKTYSILPNIQFNPQSRFISWAVCQQSTDYDAVGNLIYLQTPKPVLIMQDGSTRAAMWDGVTSRHLNPTYSGNPDSTRDGLDETVIGLWMVWSNNRLWVSNGNKVIASDIGNPTKFTEAQFLAEVRAFYLPHECTGITQTPDQTGIICFTEYEGVFIQSSVQDRTQWESLSNGQMQNTILPHSGCTSARSIVTQYGLLWWFSPNGMINMNAALRQNLSSKMEAADFEMFNSKYYMGGATMDAICGISHENFLLESVPSGDSKNRHTWCLDQNPAGRPRVVENIYGFEFTNAWASTWTGWRPVEWCKGMVDGVERVFFQSIDFDGSVRIWEMFTGNTGTDNGVPITSWFMSKDHNFKSIDRKKFRWAEFSIRDLLGNASLMVAYAGRRGTYTPIFAGDMCATQGQVYYAAEYGNGGYGNTLLAGNRSQTRYFRTGDTVSPDSCNACGIESTDPNNEDTQFSLLFVWSGKMGIEWYRIMCMEDPRPEGGETGLVSEDCPRSLNNDGCSGKSMSVTTTPFGSFTSTQTYSLTIGGTAYSATHTAKNMISQKAADNAATAMAYMDVVWQAGLAQ
jgi:hypothetical protein